MSAALIFYFSVGFGINSTKSPGWQLRTSHILSNTSTGICFIVPRHIAEIVGGLMPVRSASSFCVISRIASITLTLNLITLSHLPLLYINTFGVIIQYAERNNIPQNAIKTTKNVLTNYVKRSIIKSIKGTKEITAMTKSELIAKIEALNEWETLMEEAKAEAEAIRDSIKAEMLERETEELEAGAYIIRWTSILSNRFDTTGFKKAYGELYKAFTKQTSSRRFSISC